MGDVIGCALPFVVFLAFFVYLKRQEHPRGERPSGLAAIRDAGRDPRAWTAMAVVVGIFLVAFPLERSLADRPSDEQGAYAIAGGVFVLLVVAALITRRGRGSR